MSDREKKLTVAVVLIVGLWFGNWGWQKYSAWKQAAIAQQTTAASNAQNAFLERQQARMAVNKLKAWREMSLPANPTVAQSQYRAWLIETLQQARLDVDDVNPRRAGQRSDAYEALSYVVSSDGKLDAVVRFLTAFYQSDQLHKITTLSLLPIDGSDTLRVSLTVEALVVTEAERESGLAQGKSKRLKLPSAEEYVERIVGRNPFVAYKPPPPPRKDPPQVVRKDPPPRKPPKPSFNHADHAKLTGVVSVGDDYQAWIWVQTLDERLYLRKGDDVKIGLFEGTVIDIYRRELLIETDDGVLAFRVGDKLSDGRQLTQAPTGS